MSGKRYLLDTNAIVDLLKGNPELALLVSEAEWIGISIINKIEYLAFKDLNEHDRILFDRFASRVSTIDLTDTQNPISTRTIAYRKSYGVKLPDAIVAATATEARAVLVTADKEFKKIIDLSVHRFVPMAPLSEPSGNEALN